MKWPQLSLQRNQKCLPNATAMLGSKSACNRRTNMRSVARVFGDLKNTGVLVGCFGGECWWFVVAFTVGETGLSRHLNKHFPEKQGFGVVTGVVLKFRTSMPRA